MAMREAELRELMAGQLGMWYAQQLAPENRSFYISEYLEIHGPVDHDLLVEAARLRTEEVEALRLRIRLIDGSPRQYVHDAADYPVHVVDASTEAAPHAAALAWMHADLDRPMKVVDEPLSSTAIIKVADDRHIWYTRMHHLVLDGQGALLIATRASEIYTALVEGRSPAEGAVEPVSVMFDADAAYRASTDFKDDQAYWHHVLADHPAVSGDDSYRSRRAQQAPLRHTDGIDQGASEALLAAARRLRTSLPGLVISAAALYQRRLTGEQDVVIGLPVRARFDKRTLGIPGMTSNIIPLRLSIGPESTVEDVIRQTSRVVRDGLRHQGYRYKDMLGDLNIVDSDLCGLHINVMHFDYDLRFGPCSSTAHNLSTGPVDDVRIDIYGRSGLQINVDVNPERHDTQGAVDVSRRFMNLVHWMSSVEPTELADRAELMDAGERRRVLVEWNDTVVGVEASTLSGLFEAQVVRS
ncbi:condensation domain-containing protein, partial [Streptomyces sp. NPDC097727]|uniref:condensation domain-containing protein n=1 Tax=Streptomyces sp. NPDC097727 TaxID=3366092 RepID=UPI003806E650